MYLITASQRRDRRFLSTLILSAALFVLGCTDVRNGTPARLTDLQIAGTKTTLNPAFDPEIFRYSIIAQDVPGDLNITSFAANEKIISIDGSRTNSGVTETIVAPLPGDTIRIEVRNRRSDADNVVTYEIIYLPPDFPEIQVTVLEPGVSPDPLYVNLFSPSSNYVAILNNHGVPDFFRKDEQVVIDFKWHSTTGERSYTRFTGERNQWGRRQAEVVVLDSDFNEVERVTTTGLTHTDNHDFLILPGSELLLLSYDGSIRDMTAFGLSDQELVEDSVVQIIDRASRAVMFEWNSWEQIPFDEQTYPQTRGEYAHVNSAIVDADGNIIISARGSSQVLKISRPGSQVIWKMGGKSNQFAFINDPFAQLCGQHFAQRLPSGNLLIFDNGQNCWPLDPSRGDLTRIVEYEIDEQLLQAELVWSYTQADAYSTAQGSAQRLENGNTLIGWGRGPGLLATEVSADGDKVFEISASIDGAPAITYRAVRYPE